MVLSVLLPCRRRDAGRGNDHSCAYVMLGGNQAYAPPTGSWEKRYVELPQDGIADLREFRIGVNPRGHKLTLWIRNISLLKKQ